MSHAPAPGPAPAGLLGRRAFFQRLARWGTVAVGGLATLALGIPVVGYLLGALTKRNAPWIPLGPVHQFPVGETRVATFDNPLSQPWDGMVARTECFVCNLGKDEDGKHQFRVLAVNCAHLGCPVSWFPQSGLFMCPCHGGVYYENGERASGPPPRGLFQCVTQVSKDGQLQLQAPHLPTLQDTLTASSVQPLRRREERS
jgi:nitrite reductase/ring-hydroxylating ferredoxin subunit